MKTGEMRYNWPMDARYIHQDHEAKLYQLWETADVFNPDSAANQRLKTAKGSAAQPFCIIMPPPNANNPLHTGHAMFLGLEDVLIRFHRMSGDDTLWLPGADHAGIETQFIFEKKLKKDGQSRFNFDRQTLYQMIWDYVQENRTVALDQMKKLGASADWSRFTFTLDPKVVTTVLETFDHLHRQGLVYRDLKLVNYCPHCGTSYSELEVKHIERTTPFYYLKYGQFVIGTVRPETKFRDTALAVNPSDPRYQDLIGQTFSIPGLLGLIEMKIIADDAVDPEFGTGIMKVTPAHDPHDFELGQRYNLPVTPIIDFNGRMDFSWYIASHQDPQTPEDQKYLERATKYHGKKVAQARELMVEDLRADGLLLEVKENYVHSIGTCYRCGNILEPLPLPQFFIKVKPLVEPVLAALQAGKIDVHGTGYDKILTHWLENLKDWNISRQIVWGIRLPIWYELEKNPQLQITFLAADGQKLTGTIGELLQNHDLAEIKAGLQELRAPIDAEFELSPTPPGDNYLQETDTFDTWFSSGQWPFATLKNTQPGDLERFYPTQVMETGYDILPFWVMRMLMLGQFATGELPFNQVYLHGLIRDAQGQKMSKSKGNVINPLEVIEKYGADALRMALVIRSTPGLDKSVGDQDFKAMRNFTNKIWNAARFVIMNQDQPTNSDSNSTTAAAGDEAFQAHLNQVVKDVTDHLHQLRLGLAADTLYTEFWHWFCDECIEAGKRGEISQKQLLTGLQTFLTLIHPFMPFVTEAVWQELHVNAANTNPPLLATTAWPNSDLR
jgi:valyl-tRNA synthetase